MNKHDMMSKIEEVTTLYQNQYKQSIELLSSLKSLVVEHSKKQYMDPDNMDFITQLGLLNADLQDLFKRLE